MSGSSASNQIFDPSILDSLHEAIGDSINRIILIYIDDFPNNLSEMRLASGRHEYATIGRLAHSLKSSSGNLGATELVALAIDLESYVQSEELDESVVSIKIENIEQAFNSVQPQLSGYIR